MKRKTRLTEKQINKLIDAKKIKATIKIVKGIKKLLVYADGRIIKNVKYSKSKNNLKGISKIINPYKTIHKRIPLEFIEQEETTNYVYTLTYEYDTHDYFKALAELRLVSKHSITGDINSRIEKVFKVCWAKMNSYSRGMLGEFMAKYGIDKFQQKDFNQGETTEDLGFEGFVRYDERIYKLN